jgi:hypothetical protein
LLHLQCIIIDFMMIARANGQRPFIFCKLTHASCPRAVFDR